MKVSDFGLCTGLQTDRVSKLAAMYKKIQGEGDVVDEGVYYLHLFHWPSILTLPLFFSLSPLFAFSPYYFFLVFFLFLFCFGVIADKGNIGRSKQRFDSWSKKRREMVCMTLHTAIFIFSFFIFFVNTANRFTQMLEHQTIQLLRSSNRKDTAKNVTGGQWE